MIGPVHVKVSTPFSTKKRIQGRINEGKDSGYCQDGRWYPAEHCICVFRVRCRTTFSSLSVLSEKQKRHVSFVDLSGALLRARSRFRSISLVALSLPCKS